jgi:hypothetical protein
MFQVGDVVLLILSGDLKSHHKDLYDEMERRGLKKIKGEVREITERVVWVDFSSGDFGGKKGEQYALPPESLKKVSSTAEKAIIAEIAPAPPSEF